jgi:hypothetical protein
MKTIITLLTAFLLLTANIFAQYTPESTSQQLRNTIIFPVEVFGKNGATESIYLNINDAANLTNIAGLRVKIHGLTYTNKASIKVNNSKWYDINNSNVVFLNKYEAIYQGMGNTYFTGPVSTFNLFLAIPSTNFYSTNTITFKFNDYNGLTIGYRLLDIGIVKSNYTDLVLHTKKAQDDPSKWKPFSTNAANINNGSNKWFNATITHNGEPIRARCEDCHVHEGYDLKYFNYSNKSIVLRSTALHSLSLQDAQDIASFIRTRDVPYEEKGRPWNPPYQPGPGLDSKPVRSWAAGAGLEWVLMDDAIMLTNLFPAGILTNLVNYGTNGLQSYNPLLTLNQREIPQIIPFPDWNRWLPHFHPLDSWSNWQGTNYYPTRSSGMLGVYQQWYNTFKNLTNKSQAPSLLNTYHFRLGEARSTVIRATWPVAWNTNGWGPFGTKILADYGLKNMSDFKWMDVKNFEIMKIFEFEELGGGAGTWEDKRRWYLQANTVFFTAPHTTKPDTFSYEIRGMVPYSAWGYESASWYQMAMVLNSGNRNNIDQIPLDQGYFTAFGWQNFYPYKLSSSAPKGITNVGWYTSWTNRPLGIGLLDLIKAMEFTEKGATNVPNGYTGNPPWVNMGFYPSGSVSQAFNLFFDPNQIPYTDKTILTFLITTYTGKYCDMVSRFTAAQYNWGTPSGTMASELYNTLFNWERGCIDMRTRYSMDLTSAINKIKTTRNTLFPSQP